MREKTTISLVYEGKDILVDGSPVILEERKVCNANIEKQFSQYYYKENHRVMRQSKNLTIPSELANDFVVAGVRYKLRNIEIGQEKYYVKEILRHKSSMLKILDCEEML